MNILDRQKDMIIACTSPYSSPFSTQQGMIQQVWQKKITDSEPHLAILMLPKLYTLLIWHSLVFLRPDNLQLLCLPLLHEGYWR